MGVSCRCGSVGCDSTSVGPPQPHCASSVVYALAGVRLHLFCVMGEHRTRAQNRIGGVVIERAGRVARLEGGHACERCDVFHVQYNHARQQVLRFGVIASPRSPEGEWGRPRGATGRHMRRSPAPCCAASGIAVGAGGVRCDVNRERGRRLRVARGALVRYIGLNTRTCVHACVHACMRACVHACARASYRRRDSQKLTLGQRRCC